MSFASFYPDERTSRFMALTGSNLDQAKFCLEAANHDFSAAVAVFRHANHLDEQQEPPSHVCGQGPRPISAITAAIGNITSFLFPNEFSISRIATGLVVLVALNSLISGLQDFGKDVKTASCFKYKRRCHWQWCD